MILDFSRKVAVKCSECGKYNIMDINIFEIKSPVSFKCSCGHRALKAGVARGELFLDIECIACENTHSYRFRLKDILERPMNIISCQQTGMEIAFLGKDYLVDDFVNRYMDDMLELLRSMGIVSEKTLGVK